MVKPSPFEYHRPVDVNEAVRLLKSFGGSAKVIAGGQSLLPIMNMRLAEPEQLVDIHHLPELRKYTANDDIVRYGAAITHGMVEDGVVPDASGGLMQRAAQTIGYRAIRNRGTLGGSLAHSDASAEWPTVMAALNASVEAVSIDGTRRIPVRELLQGFFTTSLADEEIISSIEVPVIHRDTYVGIHKMARKEGEFADSLAVCLFNKEGGHYSDISLWLGAAQSIPVPLPQTQRHLEGLTTQDVGPKALRPLVAEDIGESTSLGSATADYTLQLHAVSVHRALLNARKGGS